MKKITQVILITTVIMLISIVSFATMSIDECKNGVVRIITSDGSDMYQGSGFAIGIKGKPVTYIVTNYHVVDGMEDVYLFRGEDDLLPLYLTGIALQINDVVVLELEEPLFDLTPLVLKTEGQGKVGEDIFALGFPANSDALDVTFSGKAQDVTVTGGIINKIAQDENNIDFYQIDATINGGNSGGPLIDKDGNVIGICSFGLVDDQGNSYGYNGAMMVSALVDALNSRGYAFETTEGSSASEQAAVSESTPSGENSAEVQSEDTSNTKVLEASLKQESKQLPIALIALAVVSVVVVIGIVLFRGKNSKNKNTVMNNQTASVVTPVAPVSANIPAKASVIGLKGHLAGRTFEIEGIKTVGRNQGNFIKYPNDYKGISGNHCLIEFDHRSNLVLLSDNGSSYGTFLSNGQKLVKGSKVALNNGDQFYLASIDDLFEVRI